MYLRATQRRNKDGSVVRYYALAENARHPEKGHVEARVVHSFGRADRLDRAVLERLVASIRRVLGEVDGTPVVERPGAGAIEIEAVFELGVVHVVKSLWERLGIAGAIASRVAEKKLKAPHLAALLSMTMQRLERPGSKLACHERWLERVWLPEAQDLALGQLYRRPGGLRSDPWKGQGQQALEARRSIYSPSTAMPSSRRSFGVAWISSSSMSIWCSTMPRPPGSRPTRRMSPAMNGAG